MKKYLFCLLAVLPLCSFGEVEPVIIGFSSTNDVYTVPAGKVLVIECITGYSREFADGQYEGAYLSHAAFIFSTGSSTHGLQLDLQHNDSITPLGQYTANFPRPLKLPAGTSIKVVTTSVAYPIFRNGGNISIFGLLVDPSDLYASIETQSEGMLCQGGMFQFDLLASSSRPGTLKLSGSTDLQEWQSISSAQIAKTETDKFSVTVPTEGHSKYFVKPDLQSVGQ